MIGCDNTKENTMLGTINTREYGEYILRIQHIHQDNENRETTKR